MFKKLFSKNNGKETEDKTEDKTEESPDEDLDEAAVSITYYVKESGDDVFLDIFIKNYEDSTISKISKILSGLSSLRLSVETMAMIKDSLSETEDEEVFVQIVNNVMRQTEDETQILEKLASRVKEAAGDRKKEDQPWIKPSEIIR